MVRNKIGFYTAIALVIANMIGTGVFTSLGFQTTSLPSISVVLILWLCGGIIAMCGGLSYIELAKLMPGSGGEYHYIRTGYSIQLARLAGIISVIAGFSAPVALAGIALSAYTSQLYPQINIKVMAFIIITIITLFHCFNLQLGSRFQLVSTSIKLVLIITFIICGCISPVNHLNLSFNQADQQLIGSKSFLSSLVYVSFAYSGWNASTYIFTEIDRPLRNIKQSVIIGTMIVTVLYLLLNLIFLKVIPIAQTVGVIEIGALAASSIFGISGGKIVALIISLLLVSTISAMVWIGPRVIDAMRPKTKGNNLPLTAIFLQYTVTITLLFTGSFEYILSYTGIGLSFCSCIAVSMLFLKYKAVSRTSLLTAFIYFAATIWSCFILLFE